MIKPGIQSCGVAQNSIRTFKLCNIRPITGETADGTVFDVHRDIEAVLREEKSVLFLGVDKCMSGISALAFPGGAVVEFSFGVVSSPVLSKERLHRLPGLILGNGSRSVLVVREGRPDALQSAGLGITGNRPSPGIIAISPGIRKSGGHFICLFIQRVVGPSKRIFVQTKLGNAPDILVQILLGEYALQL